MTATSRICQERMNITPVDWEALRRRLAMTDIIFVHGMFQNPKSWQKWTSYFSDKGYHCVASAWPLHAGEPSALRANPPAGPATFI
jgi:alpha-beta hydrolase superfamily lysophospholipase